MKTFLIFAEFTILFLTIIMVLLLIKSNRHIIKLKGHYKEDSLDTSEFKDDMTGLYNSDAYDKHIWELKRTRKTQGTAIVLFDIDNFRETNNEKEVLKLVGNVLTHLFEPSRCRVYRISENKFAVISNETSELEIVELLISFRTSLEKRDVQVSYGYSVIYGSVELALKEANEMLQQDMEHK